MAPLPASETYEFCSIYSQQEAAEPLPATATRADIWLSLEYAGRWGARAFPESDLPEAVKAHITTFESAMPNVRTQFIRRPGNDRPQPVHFFVSVANAREPRLYRFELQSYAQLLDIDLEGVVGGNPAYAPYISAQRLFLVCNNGLRDACCAKFGIPVQQAVAAVAGEDAWQCTHIGGHRLAPNLLFLPHALSYGRGTPEIASRLVESYFMGQVYLPLLRGRTIYSRPVQAAEHFLRQETGNAAVEAYGLVAVDSEEDGSWRVMLAGDGREYLVRVAARPWPEPVYKTCDAIEKALVEHYELLSLS
jgi:hypothetical protein